MMKVRDIAAALEIADWLREHRGAADDELLIAASSLLEHFEKCGWQITRIRSSEGLSR